MEHKGTVILETPRLILRPYRLEDAEAMYRNWASDEAVTEYLTWPPHESIAVTKTLLELWTGEYAREDRYNWTLELKGLGEPVGALDVVGIQESIGEATLGWCLGSPWWGQGLMPEAAQAVLRFLFREVGFRRIAAQHDLDNPKSGRVMEKIGMRREGIRRKGGRNRRGIVDLVCYAILAEEFEG